MSSGHGAVARPASRTADLVERESELAVLDTVVRRGGVVSIEAGAGVGKTSLLEAACALAQRRGRLVLRARGSDLEREFAFGIVRQLLERRVLGAAAEEREALLAGPARPALALFGSGDPGRLEPDSGFAVLHALYWLCLNLAERAPLLVAVDDAHEADQASLRWLAHLAPRIGGAELSLLVALRPEGPASSSPWLLAVRGAGPTLRPALLSPRAVGAIVRRTHGEAREDLVNLAHRATGGNPFYLRELLRALGRAEAWSGSLALEDVVRLGGVDGVTRSLRSRLRGLDPGGLRLAHAVAILGDGCELRHAAAVAELSAERAVALATELAKLEVLAGDPPCGFVHPIVRQAALQTLSIAEREAAHRTAARVLHAAQAPPGQVATHLMALHPAGDAWAAEGLRAAARAAIEEGVPGTAADLLERALVEPPTPERRIAVLRELAFAQRLAGREGACRRLEEALALATDEALRVELASDLARAHAALFRWSDAVEALERALARARGTAALELEGQLVAVGLQDARTAPRALRGMERLAGRRLSGAPARALAAARGLVAVLDGGPAAEVARPLEAALARDGAGEDDWDLRAALLWSLVTAERFETVEAALGPLRDRVRRSGSARGLVCVYSTEALLELARGDLAQADAAARIALRVAEDGDFSRGLPFAATLLAEIDIASGDLEESQALLDRLPQGDLPAGLGTVRIPAARGRLHLARGRPEEALREFETCLALWRSEVWGIEMRDVGYLHARAGAAQALLGLGDVQRARELAEAELADVRRFGGRRALGVTLRVAGLARGGARGLAWLEESAAVLAQAPARLERAVSLVEWGAALRRAGRRPQARQVLALGLDGAARCGARPLAARAREELRVAGARPRRDWSLGVEALTASELRIAQLAREGRTNRQIAQELYLSIKTVEGHLARAYGKLGIAQRAELARVLDPEKSRVPTR